MKAAIAALCLLAAVVCVIALLPEGVCRAPHPVSSCASGTPITTMYYFDNHTDRCQNYLGCGGGYNDFGSLGCCMDSCPYGRHHPPGKRGKGRKL
uniref:Putative secreted protein n=1 Tax=Ixodes scapularis TaxID=6945 RepID=Q8MVF0_IXOSC|nr:putative secreted protein [Ixodes scapularis]